MYTCTQKGVLKIHPVCYTLINGFASKTCWNTFLLLQFASMVSFYIGCILNSVFHFLLAYSDIH